MTNITVILTSCIKKEEVLQLPLSFPFLPNAYISLHKNIALNVINIHFLWLIIMTMKMFILCALYLLASPVSFAVNLCLQNEKTSFTCGVGSKSISVCSANERTVIYRFGTPELVELEIESVVHFSRTSYSGGGAGHLVFSNGKYKYIVYSRGVSGEFRDDGSREYIETAGVYVIKNENILADVECKTFSGDEFIGYLPSFEEEEFEYY